MRSLTYLSVSLAALVALGSCASPSAPPPRPVARPVPVPTYTPPPPPPASSDWRDWPLTPGTWTYRQDARGSVAMFGSVGADAALTLRCDRASRIVYLSRPAQTAGGAMIVRTSTTLRSLPTQPTGGTPAHVAATLGANDPLLDAIGFSRGRFVVEQAGQPTLVVPTWAEILRVTEDCRG